MGTYTQLVFECRISSPMPRQVYHALSHMTRNDYYNYTAHDSVEYSDHPLFKARRWAYMLRCDSSYFDGDTHSTFRYDDVLECYILTVRCNLKNYGMEIEKFLNWLAPFVDSYDEAFHGYKLHEEDSLPTLILFKTSGETKEFIYVECNETSRRVLDSSIFE